MQSKERTVMLRALQEEIEMLRQQLDEAYRAAAVGQRQGAEIGKKLDQKVKYMRLHYEHLML